MTLHKCFMEKLKKNREFNVMLLCKVGQKADNQGFCDNSSEAYVLCSVSMRLQKLHDVIKGHFLQ
jgi:hypothetical protein